MTTTTPNASSTATFNNAYLNEIGLMLYERGFETLFESLGVDLYRSGKRYVGCCPIHEGDNANAINFYPDGDDAKGNWVCRTNGCHSTFHKSPVGFTRGVISRRHYGWSGHGDTSHMATIKETVRYLLDLLGIKETDVKPDPQRAARHRFNNFIGYITRKPPEGAPISSRDAFRASVVIPSPYYLARGYSPEVLDRFDVGECRGRGRQMWGRAVVPLYDTSHANVIGAIGRSTSPMCPQCGYYHVDGLPCPSSDLERWSMCKWQCSRGFVDKHYLYNYWSADKQIVKSRCIVLVEGPGDVWRLAEAGVDNAVAVLGVDVTDSQVVALQCCRARHFILIRDMDEAGDRLAARLRHECNGNLHVLSPPGGAKDVGDMSVEQVRDLFLPFIYSKMQDK